MKFEANHFRFFDYFAVAATLFLSLGIGVYFSLTGKHTKDEVLLGGRKMKIFPVSASMMVTYFSAVAIMGYPSEIYSQGSQIFVLNLMSFVTIPLSAFIYVRVFYEMKLTSVYEYLQHRFESVLVRWIASLTFILQVCLLNGVILYAPAIALKTFVGIPVWISITSFGFSAIIYTSIGGLKAVVWTDVFQFFMIMFGLFSIVIKGFIKAGGVANGFQTAYDRGRLSLLDFTLDPFMRHNTFNIIFGHGFTVASVYGTNQPLVQRYCSLPTASGAVASLVSAMPLKLFANTVMLLCGIAIVATYAGCDPILRGEISKPDALIAHFVIEELATIPGMMGIFTSCISSAVLSSVSSTLNSLSAVTWEDFLSKLPHFRNLSSESQATTTKYLVCFYGILSIVLALGAQSVGQILEIAMRATGATGAPLSGIFLAGLFIPIMNKYGALVGMIAGLVTSMVVTTKSVLLNKQYIMNPSLTVDLNDCPDMLIVNQTLSARLPRPEVFDYPEKLFTVSYLLIPLLGSMITVFVGCAVSILTGGLRASNCIDEKCFHPWIRNTSYVVKFAKRPDKVEHNGEEMKSLSSK